MAHVTVSTTVPRTTALSLARRGAQSLWLGLVGFYRSDNLTYAASLAYYTLLSIFPFGLLGLMLVGTVTSDDTNRQAVLAFVLRYFPAQFAFVSYQLAALHEAPPGLGVVGTLGVVWGALGIFGAISTSVNYAWGVPQGRSYWRHKLFSFAMLLVAGLLLLLAMLLLSAAHLVGTSAFARVVTRFPALALLQGLVVGQATTALFVLVVGLVFYFVPNTRVRFRDVWAGAVLTGVLWKTALTLFAAYVSDMARFTRINGSMAVVVVFLLWVYVQAVIVLYGVEFTAAWSKLTEAEPTTR